MKSIYSYIDYQPFLADYFRELKKKDAALTFRSIKEALGLKTTSFFKYVLDNKRQLTPEMAMKTADFFNLRKGEKAYFLLMVKYARVKTVDEKQTCYLELLKKRPGIYKDVLEKKQFSFFSKWYHTTIIGLLENAKYPLNYEKIGNSLRPQITGPEVRRSINILLKLGLIKKDEKGRFKPIEPVRRTGVVRDLEVKKYQMEMLKRNIEAFDRFSDEERMGSALTLYASEECFKKMRDKCRDFRNELLDMAKNDKNPVERVYNINLHMFPTTRILKEQL